MPEPSDSIAGAASAPRARSLKNDLPPERKENLKETVESILVAFILAFVFRAFVVEAFVIPSGSMAPTLLGAHMRFRCEECGYDWVLNYPTDSRKRDITVPSHAGPLIAPKRDDQGKVRTNWLGNPDFEIVLNPVTFSTHCPNCGFQAQPDNPGTQNSSANAPIHYGDRILVLKYLYLIQEPARWDVVVFKAPPETAENYIKRLVGKPGEALMLLDGDVYVRPLGAAENDTDTWRIQTKPRSAQETLWRIVHDNDYLATNLHAKRRARPWVTPWKQRAGHGWSVAQRGASRIIHFDNSEGAGTLFFDKDANPGIYPLTDWLPYNETKPFRHLPETTEEAAAENRLNLDFSAYTPTGGVARWYVNDLKLKFVYDRRTGDGPFRASLTKREDTFVAEFMPGIVRLFHLNASGKQRQVGGDIPLDSGPVRVEFTNVDYQVFLRINGRDAIRTTRDDYRPDLRRLRELHDDRTRLANFGHDPERIRRVFGVPRIEMSAERQSSSLTHLSLWRDVYYTPTGTYDEYHRGIGQGSPENPVRLLARGQGDASQENEYFCLGDNSGLSSDGRAWSNRIMLKEEEDLFADSGKVPERFLLGQAFFVYWPAGFRPFTSETPGIIPNFGAMRPIH